MSPTDPGRFTNPAVTRHPAELMIPLHPGEERLWVLDDDPSKGPPTTNLRPSPLASSAAVLPRQNFRPIHSTTPATTSAKRGRSPRSVPSHPCE
jgi:hypothetical protein